MGDTVFFAIFPFFHLQNASGRTVPLHPLILFYCYEIELCE